MSDEYVSYKQCEFRHPATGAVDVAWLPNRFATKGRKLVLKGQTGWVVTEVYGSTQMNMPEMLLRRDAHKRFKHVLGR